MKRWSISVGKDGWSVELLEDKWYAYPLERAADLFLEATLHLFCCKTPEWTYKIPMGKPRYIPDPLGEEEPWMDNSLGTLMWDIGQKVYQPAWRASKRLKQIPISEEIATELNPKWVSEYNELMSDDEDE